MNKSIRTYRIQDLLLLTVLGCVLEGIATYVSGLVLDGAPTIGFSFLVLFIAITRWGLWGLVTIPFLALGTMVGGMFSQVPYFAAFYKLDWRLYLSIILSLPFMGLNVIFFRNHRTKKIVGSAWKLSLMVIADYVIYCTVQFILYRLLYSGSIAVQGVREFTYQKTNSETGELETIVENVCRFGDNGFIYNLFGLAITFIGLFILRSQGVVNNAVDKLVDDKKARDAEASYLKSLGNGSKREEAYANSAIGESKEEEKKNDSSEQ